MSIVFNVIQKKLYRPVYVGRSDLKDIFDADDTELTDSQVEEIIENSPQQHKEAGFDKGWQSRFDTWYKLPMEFGFVFYAIDTPLVISNTGHMLIDAYNEIPVNEIKIQNVLLNSLMKYKSDNPFRKNANSNVPLVLLLKVLELLKQDKDENGAGVFRQELSLFICWRDDNAENLYECIKNLRKLKNFTYSDEYMYDICLDLLGVGNDKKNRFKIEQITGEAVDEYIRKMRSTGIISLRGNGRFIDFNTFEYGKINYILENYSSTPVFQTKEDFFGYMGKIDTMILSVPEQPKQRFIEVSDLRKKKLYEYAKQHNPEKIFDELLRVCNKRESTDLVFRVISAPARLEFLTSIALVQQFSTLDVNPSYTIDDEGLPTCTAMGGVADIVCYDTDCGSLVEVTLMCGRQEQVHDEIIPIRRHLLEALKSNPNTFSIFIAPKVHTDTVECASWYKERDKIDILTFSVDRFVLSIKEKHRIIELLNL
ncbi:hypothetical protein FACS1894188_05280 [Clostridia bacterium]|nr:hypothetical protein FACS1894188_05280 [Clostridia bacterium]